MGFIEAMRGQVEHLATFAALDSPGAQLPAAVLTLDDDALRAALAEVADLSRTVTTLQAALAGAVARRSPRSGPGVARDGGFRNPVEMIRAVGGLSKAEATRAVQVGESLMDAAEAGDAPTRMPVRSGPPKAQCGISRSMRRC